MHVVAALWLVLALLAPASRAAEGRVIKVLPHLLDARGRHALSPSLYERDAYQAVLRSRPETIHGVRFDVLWKATGPAAGQLRLRLEVRGAGENAAETLETDLTRGRFRRWARVVLSPEQFRRTGSPSAWKATLLEEGRPIGSMQSFLW
jgi:hypothetical protein